MARGAGYAVMGTVFLHVCASCGGEAARAGEAVVGLSSDNATRSEAMWRSGLAGVRRYVPSTGCGGAINGLVTAESITLPTTFLAQQEKGGNFCHLCMGTDHTTEECVLAPLQPRSLKSGPQGGEKGEHQGVHWEQQLKQETCGLAGGRTKYATPGTREGADFRYADTGIIACDAEGSIRH